MTLRPPFFLAGSALLALTLAACAGEEFSPEGIGSGGGQGGASAGTAGTSGAGAGGSAGSGGDTSAGGAGASGAGTGGAAGDGGSGEGGAGEGGRPAGGAAGVGGSDPAGAGGSEPGGAGGSGPAGAGGSDPAGAGGSDPAGAGGASGSAGQAGASGQAGTGGCATKTTTTLSATADTFILNEDGNNKNPSISYGDADNLNLGQSGFGGKKSRILIRFSVSELNLNMLLNNNSVSLELKLTRLSGEDETSICEGMCPFNEGAVRAYALRNDWDEDLNLSDGYSGARWFKRRAGKTGDEWGLPGADKEKEDRSSDSIGFADINIKQGEYTIPLDPKLFFNGVSPVNPSIGEHRSVLLVPDENLTTFFYSREKGGNAKGPKLVVKYCE